jgi:hypothetical protein
MRHAGVRAWTSRGGLRSGMVLAKAARRLAQRPCRNKCSRRRTNCRRPRPKMPVRLRSVPAIRSGQRSTHDANRSGCRHLHTERNSAMPLIGSEARALFSGKPCPRRLPARRRMAQIRPLVPSDWHGPVKTYSVARSAASRALLSAFFCARSAARPATAARSSLFRRSSSSSSSVRCSMPI